MEIRSENLLTTRSHYRTIFGCDLCGITWVTPAVECTLEQIFWMNTKMQCPSCTACEYHEDAHLKVPPEVLKIEEVGNEFSLIAQF
jgi:hypothetical protein